MAEKINRPDWDASGASVRSQNQGGMVAYATKSKVVYRGRLEDHQLKDFDLEKPVASDRSKGGNFRPDWG